MISTRAAAIWSATGLSGGPDTFRSTRILAVKNTVVGYFNLHTREYQQVELPEDLELVSFMGNLTWTGGEPFIHAHVTLSDSGCSARGGHLFSSEIAVTGEFVIQPTGLRLEREHDPRTGLNLISNGGS